MGTSASMVGVFGASGRTGARVLEALAARGVKTRALGRHSDIAGASETAFVDLDDAGSVTPDLFNGLRAVYLVIPRSLPDEGQRVSQIVQAVAAAGVEHMVLHSVLHPHTRAMTHHMAHADAEDAVRHGGVAWTILQPAMYVQSVSTVLVPQPDGADNPTEVQLPWSPTTLMSPVHLGDVADAAATVLCDDGHANATYELAGPDLLGLDRMIDTIAAVTGRALTTTEVDGTEFARHLAGSEAEIRTWAAMFAEYGAHGLVGNPRVLGWLLGRNPTSFRDAITADLQRN